MKGMINLLIEYGFKHGALLRFLKFITIVVNMIVPNFCNYGYFIYRV